MATSESKTKLRQYRRENGLCIHCGEVAVLDETMCQKCKDRSHVTRKERSLEHEAQGICKNDGCFNLVEEGYKYCTTCNDRSTKNSSKLWYERTENNLCGDCGKPIDPGTYKCVSCGTKSAAQASIRRQTLIDAGLCANCGGPKEDDKYKHCTVCRGEKRNYHAERKIIVLDAYGGPVCVGCGETEICVLQMDHINGGGSKHAKEIGPGRLYGWLIKNGFPEGYRVLCANCNVRAHRKQPFPNELRALKDKLTCEFLELHLKLIKSFFQS